MAMPFELIAPQISPPSELVGLTSGIVPNPGRSF